MIFLFVNSFHRWGKLRNDPVGGWFNIFSIIPFYQIYISHLYIIYG